MRDINAVLKANQAVMKIKPEKCRHVQDMNPTTPTFLPLSTLCCLPKTWTPSSGLSRIAEHDAFGSIYFQGNMFQDKDAAERNFTHINHCFSTGIYKIEILMKNALTWSDSQSGHTLTIVSYNCRDSFGVSAISPGKPFSKSCLCKKNSLWDSWVSTSN